MDELIGFIESTSERLPWLPTLVGLVLLVLAAAVVVFLARRVLVRVVERVIRRTQVRWDDALLERKVLAQASLAAPLVVIYYGIHLVPGLAPRLAEAGSRISLACLILVFLVVASSLLSAANDVYSRHPISRGRPIKGYVQIAQILVFLFGGILVAALLLDRSPWVFMTGIGAMTAVLLLIFRDTILSFVASIQIVSNDMVRIGDWIEMPDYGADGDVIDIALHTVKVQNWDKTITTIPTYKLIQDSVKNWRGMQESGGRRIKRSIHIDMSSIRFLDERDVERFSAITLIRDYLASKRRELQEANRDRPAVEVETNARRLTNVGTFRAYVVAYLKQHPDLFGEGMTLLVRQLPPGPEGLPIEIYVFTRTTEWARYEAIQSDVFDHLLAVVPEFDLRVFQKPSGWDLAAWGHPAPARSQPAR